MPSWMLLNSRHSDLLWPQLKWPQMFDRVWLPSRGAISTFIAAALSLEYQMPKEMVYGKKIIFRVPEDATEVKHTIFGWARQNRAAGTVQRTDVNLYTAYMYSPEGVEIIADLVREQYGCDLEIDLMT